MTDRQVYRSPYSLGKAVSRFNALASGIHARAHRIAGEDAASLAALVRDDDLQ